MGWVGVGENSAIFMFFFTISSLGHIFGETITPLENLFSLRVDPLSAGFC